MQAIGASIINEGLFIIVFGSILFIAYVTTRMIAQKSNKSMKGKIISIVETVSIGFDKQLHLVKVGDEFVLISTCGKNMQFMSTIKSDGISEDLISTEKNNFDFKNIIEKYIQGFKNKKNGSVEESSNEQFTEDNNIFKKSLSRLKEINSEKYTYNKSDSIKDKDENTYDK